MTKTVLITGATDGLGLATAELLAAAGHDVVLHGRSASKLDRAMAQVGKASGGAVVSAIEADLARLSAVDELSATIHSAHGDVDVLINNAGVFRTDQPTTPDGLDVRFAVNAIAPYMITREALDSLPPDGRVVNLSSAAQSPVDLDALSGRRQLDDRAAYAQSKLALTMWSIDLGLRVGPDGPAILAVNPGSMLGTKMVREGFGVPGRDIQTGASILARAALDPGFATATGAYFDNDAGAFADPHPDALQAAQRRAVLDRIDEIVARSRA